MNKEEKYNKIKDLKINLAATLPCDAATSCHMRSIDVPNLNPFQPRVCIRITARNAIAFWRSAFVGLTDRPVGLPELHFAGSANPASGGFPLAFGENLLPHISDCSSGASAVKSTRS